MKWYSAQQLCELGLPALPADKGALSRLIERMGWRRTPLARQVDGKWQYATALLPAEAQAALALRIAPTVSRGDSEAWARFEQLPDTTKATARQRLDIVERVFLLRAGGLKAATAVTLVAGEAGIGARTLWAWLSLVEGLAPADRLPALVPQHKGRTATAECDPRAWDFFVADYLRPERPSYTACYRRLEEAAAAHGWSPVPALKTLQRRIEKQFPAAAITLARQGREAVARQYPHQTRDRSGFAAMEAVNADGHKFDVFVRWPDGRTGRPVATVIQDLGTGMIVGWRLGESENWSAVRLAFADMVERFGIPEQCWLDNGRAFASKELTGGMANRYRFKVKAEEPLGILTQLGIKVHWTTPYHGQAKPIERAFRDLCEEIAKHPALSGAYTGNAIDAKPENYGSRAIPIDTFRDIVAAEIERHNGRRGRRGIGRNGESFAEAFARSLAEGAIVRKASAAQRRLLLMAAEGVTLRKPTGEIELGGNRYWAEQLVDHIGAKVTVRFDPDDLHQPIGVFARDGRLICEAQPIETSGFDNAEAAQAHSRDKRRFVKAQREALEAERRLSIEDVAELLPRLPPAAPAAPSVVRLVVPPAAPAGPRPDAARENFGRAIRALADVPDEGEIVPFRAAEAG